MKTAEEILLDKVLSEEQKEYGDQEFWKRQNRHELPKYLSAMREFAAQEVEEYKDRLKSLISQQVASNQSSHLLTESQIHGLIDTVK